MTHSVETDPVALTNCRGVSSWKNPVPAGQACDHRILPALDGRLIALDGATGKPCENFGRGGRSICARGWGSTVRGEYGITSPPAILGDLVITGAMVLDNRRTDGPGWVVRAFDVRSGSFAGPGTRCRRGRHRTGGCRAALPEGTTNVWSIISVDAKRKLVFVPTVTAP